MAPGVDVGIHAQRHAHAPAVGDGELVEAIELARRFDVDGVHVEGDGAGELRRRLADAGEDDVSGGEAAAQRHVDLAHRVGVDAAAERAHQPHDGQRGVGLQRVVDGMRARAEGGIEALVGVADGAGAVDVARRADGRRHLRDGYRLDAKTARDMLQERVSHDETCDDTVKHGSGRPRARIGRGPWYSERRLAVPPMSVDTTSAQPDAIDTLIQRCLAGDQTAWEQIVRQHWRKVFNVAYKFTGSTTTPRT